MYEIYFADLKKGTRDSNEKKRPVVVINDYGSSVRILRLTGRMREDKFHVKMNPYMVHSYCEISKSLIIDKKYLMNYLRSCTVSEVESIEKNKNYFLKKVLTFKS